MDPTHPDREPQRAGAGCPSVLATDASRNDVVEPVVEWPPSPPSRDGHRGTPSVQTGPRHDTDREAHPDEDVVARLAAGRAVSLLEASIEHLRTVLEASDDADTAARVQRAIGEVSEASEALHEFAEPIDLSPNV